MLWDGKMNASIVRGCGVVLLAVGCATVPPPVNPAGQRPPTHSVGVVAVLRDGSKLVGTLPQGVSDLVLQAEMFGRLSIAFDRIDTVEFNRPAHGATVVLQNRDQLRGQVDDRSLKLQTLLGLIALPMETIARLQFRAGGTGHRLGATDWRTMPFPSNCDWPGPQGERARVDAAGIQLLGQPVRSVQAYPLPLEFECEFTLLDPLARDGYLVVRAGPAGTADDQQPLHMIDLLVTATAGASPIHSGLVAAQYWGKLHDGRIVSRQVGPELTVGKPNRLKIRMGLDRWQVTLNNATFNIDGVQSECNPVFLDLWNWQPSSRWRVEQVVIRPAGR